MQACKPLAILDVTDLTNKGKLYMKKKRRKLKGAIYRLEHDNYFASDKGRQWDENNKEWVLVDDRKRKMDNKRKVTRSEF